MKSIREAITVEARKGVPCRLCWNGRTYRTRKLLDYWILQTRWWGREERRIYFRLLTDRGVMEVYRATGRGLEPVSERVTPAAEAGAPQRSDRPPLPMEGDTHTRERRRTDAVYRPDVRPPVTPSSTAARTPSPDAEEWMLSKIVD